VGRTALGPKLEGKIHIYVRCGDNYYLTDPVYFAQERLEALRPEYKGSVAYGGPDELALLTDGTKSAVSKRHSWFERFDNESWLDAL